MNWFQKQISLPPKPRGFHLITDEITRQMPEIGNYAVGLAHIFIQHTSASLTINESVEPEVRADMEHHFSQMVPENLSYYTHNYEGPDDMPAHIKSAMLGSSISIPISQGQLNLGRWQGIYLGEHRNRGGPRHLIVTIYGEFK